MDEKVEDVVKVGDEISVDVVFNKKLRVIQKESLNLDNVYVEIDGVRGQGELRLDNMLFSQITQNYLNSSLRETLSFTYVFSENDNEGEVRFIIEEATFKDFGGIGNTPISNSFKVQGENIGFLKFDKTPPVINGITCQGVDVSTPTLIIYEDGKSIEQINMLNSKVDNLLDVIDNFINNNTSGYMLNATDNREIRKDISNLNIKDSTNAQNLVAIETIGRISDLDNRYNDGIYQLEYQLRDRAGNKSTYHSRLIIMNLTPIWETSEVCLDIGGIQRCVTAINREKVSTFFANAQDAGIEPMSFGSILLDSLNAFSRSGEAASISVSYYFEGKQVENINPNAAGVYQIVYSARDDKGYNARDIVLDVVIKSSDSLITNQNELSIKAMLIYISIVMALVSLVVIPSMVVLKKIK